jgi:molybdopterin-containing oxidoreductase family iron-sulfur binding subunit
LGREGNTIENIRRYTAGRDIMKNSNFNRLYTVESGLSLTGMNADKRIRLRPDAQYDFVMSLLSELVLNKNYKRVEYDIRQKLSEYSLEKFAKEHDISKDRLDNLLNDVLDNPNKSIFHAGDSLPEEVHIVVNYLNELLDSSALYDYDKPMLNENLISSQDDWDQLINSINRRNVGAVIAFDSNPIYNLPENIGLKEAIKQVETVISLSENNNETTAVSDFILPINNPLESWGDESSRKGVYSLQQPVISPLYNTREKEAILLTWANGSPEDYSHDIFHKYLMNNFKNEVYDKIRPSVDFKKYWYSALHDGVVNVDERINKTSFNEIAIQNIQKPESPKGFVVKLERNYFIGNGKFANNGWLQEIPHPISKVTWDNYAAISPNTAKKLEVRNGDFLNIDINDRKIKIPAFEQPGMADDVVTIELGYGRKNAGTVSKEVGFNAIPLMSKNYRQSPWIYNNAKVEKGSGNHELVSTQNHHTIDDEMYKDQHLTRDIIQEGTVEEYKNDPHFLEEKHHAELFNIANPPIEYEGVKWGMSIDLNKCIGCSACVAACNVENNIPVVGKDQVAVGREMQWMRIDRYYSGTPDDPVVSKQPMLCQHCDNAPCENVCPVSATNHSPDGLNQMVYNRCVGTRYCSNNCPYKVRRFNFFNFRDHFAQEYYENNVTPLVNNPEVTIRSRGVMEKCTFCVQRISEARSNAIREGREVKGTDVNTACQEACPADAIVFGDVNDKDSKVSKYRNHELGYHVLRETNVRPNVTYIAKLRNTHSEEE